MNWIQSIVFMVTSIETAVIITSKRHNTSNSELLLAVLPVKVDVTTRCMSTAGRPKRIVTITMAM